MNVNPIFPSPLSSSNSTANITNAVSASSVQQQADVLSLPAADQFLSQLQQVQSPQQFQAMISQMSGQPAPITTPLTDGKTGTASSSTPPTAKHCQGGGARPTTANSSQPNAINASPASTSTAANQSLLAGLFGSVNPSQMATL
jgi:hypothetical protein